MASTIPTKPYQAHDRMQDGAAGRMAFRRRGTFGDREVCASRADACQAIRWRRASGTSGVGSGDRPRSNHGRPDLRRAAGTRDQSGSKSCGSSIRIALYVFVPARCSTEPSRAATTGASYLSNDPSSRLRRPVSRTAQPWKWRTSTSRMAGSPTKWAATAIREMEERDVLAGVAAGDQTGAGRAHRRPPPGPPALGHAPAPPGRSARRGTEVGLLGPAGRWATPSPAYPDDAGDWTGGSAVRVIGSPGCTHRPAGIGTSLRR